MVENAIHPRRKTPPLQRTVAHVRRQPKNEGQSHVSKAKFLSDQSDFSGHFHHSPYFVAHVHICVYVYTIRRPNPTHHSSPAAPRRSLNEMCIPPSENNVTSNKHRSKETCPRDIGTRLAATLGQDNVLPMWTTNPADVDCFHEV